jgi:hypothetical protein
MAGPKKFGEVNHSAIFDKHKVKCLACRANLMSSVACDEFALAMEIKVLGPMTDKSAKTNNAKEGNAVGKKPRGRDADAGGVRDDAGSKAK